MSPSKRLAMTIMATGLLVTASIGEAAWVTIQQDYNQYGHLENRGGNCAPTATANSFQYLQNRYGDRAGTLVPNPQQAANDNTDPLAFVRDMLIGGWTNGNNVQRAGMGDCGASQRSWWETKAQYIDDFGSSHVKVKGQVNIGQNNTFAGWYRGDALQNIFPQWDWLWGELAHGEDIELGLRFSDGAHAITLTSLKFDDTNGNDMWDVGEARKLDYLDPNDTSRLIEADLTLLASGALGFRWDNGNNGARDAFIDLAYSESVPEPGTLGLLALALLLVATHVRRAGTIARFA